MNLEEALDGMIRSMILISLFFTWVNMLDQKNCNNFCFFGNHVKKFDRFLLFFFGNQLRYRNFLFVSCEQICLVDNWLWISRSDKAASFAFG